ncbi:MAG: DUF1489 family protein [Rhodospirillales bacterium]|nr:DUF1489 family protein [Rhodospirillales bacterium]
MKEVAQLRAIQTLRAAADPPLRHQTRMMPKRRDDILDGGSIFWVIGGFVQLRQRLLDIIEDRWDDGTPCAGLVLDPVLVPVEARPVKAFQGWRYLDAASAPPDVAAMREAPGAQAMPEAMLRELRSLGLI